MSLILLLLLTFGNKQISAFGSYNGKFFNEFMELETGSWIIVNVARFARVDMFLKSEECCRLHKSSTIPSSIFPVVYYSKRSNLNQLLLRIPMCCKSITYQKCQLTQTLTKLSKHVKISTTDWHCKKKSTIKFISHYYSLNFYLKVGLSEL